MRRTLTPILSLFALAPAAHAVVWADDITDQTVTTFGTDARFAGVGRVSVGGSVLTGTYIGTGNGSAWMLTANHGLALNQTGTFSVGANSFSVVGAFRYNSDVMVARITSTATALAGLFVPQLNTLPTTATSGLNVISAGLGLHSSQANHNNETLDAVRRGFQTKSRATTLITGATTGTGTYIEDRFDRPGDADKRAIEGFGAAGDSGSMFMNESNNQILGVLSYGDPEAYGGINQYCALTPDVSAQIYAATGISPVPEPASLVALGLGVAAFARRRRRA